MYVCLMESRIHLLVTCITETILIKTGVFAKHKYPRWQQSPRLAILSIPGKGHGQGHKVIDLGVI